MKIKIGGRWYTPDRDALMVVFDERDIEILNKGDKIPPRFAQTPAKYTKEDVAKFMEVSDPITFEPKGKKCDCEACKLIRLCEGKEAGPHYESYHAEDAKPEKVKEDPFDIKLTEIFAKQNLYFDTGKPIGPKASSRLRESIKSLLRQEGINVKDVGCYGRSIEICMDGEELKESLKPVAEKVKGILQRTIKEGDTDE